MRGNKKKHSRISFWSRIILALNIITALALLVCYVSVFIPPDKFWPGALISLSYPLLLIINLLFLIYWLLRLKGWLIISLLTIIIGWNHVKSTIKFSGNTDIPGDMNTFKVMSYNVRYFDRFSWVNKENVQTRNQIFQLIEEESPDIICFQEFYTDLTPYFRTVDSLSKKYGYPYRHTEFALVKSRQRSYGTATFSKHPIINKEIFRFTNNIHNFAIISDIVVRADTFRVFNVHFESLRLSDEDRLFINELSSQVSKQEEAVSRYRQILSKIRFASRLRAAQSREMRALISASPYPVIFCTDLNDTPFSYAYNQLTRKLNDAFVESGAGLGNTYIGFLPAFRIDYILFDPFFQSKAYRTIPQRLSDHYPVTTTLVY